MNTNTARRIRRAAAAPVLLGAMSWSLGASDAAAATDPGTPERLVAAESSRPTKVVRGLTVRPKPEEHALPVASYRLTARFGNAGSLWSSDHTGLDFAAPSGTPLVAIADGVVTEAGYDGAYGSKTVITLEDGTELWYCHQSTRTVSVGQSISAGDVIGAIGTTGNTTGPHLHLEVRRGGEPVDPAAALAEWGLNV